MNTSVKRITRLAVLATLGLIFLLIASVLPSAKLALTAIAGIFVAVTLLMYGFWWSVVVFAVTAILSLLILPTKGCAILYSSFFGLYPLAKALLEKYIKKLPICWGAKGIIFSLMFFLWWLIPSAVGIPSDILSHWYVLWPIGMIIFVIYDICFSFLIKIYIERISGYFQ